MARYIDATKLSRGLASAALRADYGEEVNRIVEIFCKAIMDEPPADVVEVVRCKDCDIPHNKWTGCPKMNGLIPPPNHFCSYGERKKS